MGCWPMGENWPLQTQAADMDQDRGHIRPGVYAHGAKAGDQESGAVLMHYIWAMWTFAEVLDIAEELAIDAGATYVAAWIGADDGFMRRSMTKGATHHDTSIYDVFIAKAIRIAERRDKAVMALLE